MGINIHVNVDRNLSSEQFLVLIRIAVLTLHEYR